MSAPTFHQPPRPPARRRRIVGFSIASAFAGVIALAFLAAGGALLYVDAKKDDDGYYTTSTEPLRSGTYALASGPLDLDFDGAEALVDETDFGRVRLHAESNGGEPVFVGIARSEDVARYLRGTAHTTVTEIDGGAFGVSFDPTYRDAAGDRRPATPAGRDLWVASATGPGKQSLEWKARDGDWSVVVMNADGSRTVAAAVSAGAKVPYIAEIAYVTLGLGLLFVIATTALTMYGTRPVARKLALA